jgi:hypothetical protein
MNPLTLVTLGNSQLQTTELYLYIALSGQVSVKIWISMVAFPAQTPSFSAYGGAIVINQSGTTHQDLLQSLTAVQNPFYGINGIMVSTNQSV